MSDTKETVTVKMELPAPPEGWEYTGEYREPLEGEWCLTCEGEILQGDGDQDWSKYPIIRKKKWYPKEGDMVWHTTLDSSGSAVLSIPWNGGTIQSGLFKDGRIYRTEQAAQTALDRIRSVLIDAADELNNQD